MHTKKLSSYKRRLETCILVDLYVGNKSLEISSLIFFRCPSGCIDFFKAQGNAVRIFKAAVKFYEHCRVTGFFYFL